MRADTYIAGKLAQVLEELGLPYPERASLEPPKDPSHGDMATNLAMLLAKEAKQPPRQIAEAVADKLADPFIERTEVAGPGFLNFVMSPAFWRETLKDIAARQDAYGRSEIRAGQKIQVEYVSANPTGPLHIGHGRGAALGDSLARCLRFAGAEVETEYYINDAGRQMRILGNSILTRYKELLGEPFELPEDFYKGDYIKDLARTLSDDRGRELLEMAEEEAIEICRRFGRDVILEDIKESLADFRVEHQFWFSETDLHTSGEIDQTLADLTAKGIAYEQDGALWFATTPYGDDKDRVLRKSNGDLTYFAADVAYHADKYARGFDLVINVWGADHHGYIPRMKAAVQAMGLQADQLEIILVQLVNLLRGGDPVAMSTRAGQFETLADVVREVGPDAARFIFLTRKSDSKLDFDLELVKERSMANPVFYVQYAHARICSLFRKATEQDAAAGEMDEAALAGLTTPEDILLLKALERFPESVDAAARTLSPHHVCYQLQELAGALHRYYTANPVLTAPDPDLLRGRLHLMAGVRRVLAIGLGLLGVEAPERMDERPEEAAPETS